MATADDLEYQITAIHDLIANTAPDQFDNATPCAKWQVRDLMNHMVGGGTMFGTALKGEPVTMDLEGPMPDMLGGDPASAWDGAAQAFCDGADSPGAMERQVTLPFATLPGQVVVEIAKFDLLVHAWDLAQATDQRFDPPAEVVEPAIATAQMIITPEARDGDTFAAEVTPGGDAAPIERLAAFTGRSV
jgi:uncharacterized protein (TIGR03086 family)